jgi:UDP-glucose 4-epimerase
VAAARQPIRGAVNVAPSGSISLSRILRLARRPSVPIPHPLFGPAMERLGRQLGAGPVYGDGVRLLRFGRGVDNRRLREEIGYEPRFDAVGAVRDFAAGATGRRIGPSLHVGDLAGRLAGVVR